MAEHLYDTLATVTLDSSTLVLERARLPLNSTYGPHPLGPLRVSYRSGASTIDVPELQTLYALLQAQGIEPLRAICGQETAFAGIVSALLDEHLSVCTLHGPYPYRQGWLLEWHYGIDLDAHLPRIEGHRLWWLARRYRCPDDLLPPLVELWLDVHTFAHAAQVLAGGSHHDSVLPVLPGALIWVVDRPDSTALRTRPSARVVYVVDETEAPVVTMAALHAVVPPAAALITTRVQALAWAQVVATLLAVQVLTPGWRHTWMEQHGVRGLAHTWITFEGSALQFLAYPVDGDLLQPVLLQVAGDLATMRWATAVLHDESCATGGPPARH